MRTCSASLSPLAPAASATTRSLSGCVSTTASALCPIDPVDPRMAMPFIAAGPQLPAASFRLPGSSASCREHPHEDVIHGGRKQPAIDPIENPAVPRNEIRGVLDAG